MAILVVEKWVVKPEKQEEHMKVTQKFRKFIRDNPELFKGVKSVKEYIQVFGGVNGMNIWLIEYNSLADYEKENARMQKDEDAKKLTQEWQALIDPATVSVDVWSPME